MSRLSIILGFIFSVILHLSYCFYSYYRIYLKIIPFDIYSYFLIYLKQQDYFISLSWGIIAAYTIYSYNFFIDTNKKIGLFSGSFLTGLLVLFSCFVLRICSGCTPFFCFLSSL